MKTPYSSFALLALATAGFAFVGSLTVRAAIVESDSQIFNSSYNVLVPGETDLLDGKTALSSVGNFQVEGSAGLATLTDGDFGQVTGNGTATSYSATGGAPGGTSATYSLGTNTLGYSLSDIEVYSGWNDNGRYQQGYTIKYSLAAAPTTFLTLYTVAPYPANYQAAPSNGAKTQISSTTGSLVTGVADVEIDFNPVANGYTGYREVVVNGTPVSIPEPSSIALVLVGGLSLAFFSFRATRRA